MRRILPGDLDALAAAICGLPDARARAEEIIGRAEVADRYTRRFGRVHARWGDGSLNAAARRSEAERGRPALDTRAGLMSMAIAAEALAAWKAECAALSRRRNRRSAEPSDRA